MSDDTSRRGSERGQGLILAMLAMTVVFAIGAIVVDFGLWLGERRGAQTDADFVALAGAWELLDSNGDPVGAANDSLASNDEQGNATLEDVTVDDTCFNQGQPDAVTVDVRHESDSLFAGIFGLFAPEIGARAKACVGAANGPLGIVPFQVDTSMSDCFESDGTPKFNSLCPLDFGASGSNPRGILDLQADGDYCSDSSGSGNLENLIVSGATGTCLISETNSCDPSQGGPWYDCVAVQNGNATKVMRAVEQRVAPPLKCDTDGSGTEEFLETVVVVFPGNPGLYEARDCDPVQQGAQISPRLASVIVLHQVPTSSNTGYPIHAFASMYIIGCSLEPPSQTPPDLEPDCNFGPGGGGGGSGHAVVYSRLVNLVVENSGTGQPSTSTTSFSISLEE
jgi:hypothetical protein